MEKNSFYCLRPTDLEWTAMAEIFANVSWSAGPSLSQKMMKDQFDDWECVIIGKTNSKISSFCTLTKHDALEKNELSPFIGYVFVFERFRGQRLSQQLLTFGEEILRKLGFTRVYLVSDEEDLYEKYGYQPLAKEKTIYGNFERLFSKVIK